MPNITYSKLLDPVSDIISLMESMMRGEFGATTGDQREGYKRIHAYCWGLHTLVMDVITTLGIENAATRPVVLERFKALNDPIKSALGSLASGFDGALAEEQHEVVEQVRDSVLSIERMMTNIWHYSLLQHDMLSYRSDEFDGAVLIQRMKTVLKNMDLSEPPARFLVIGDETYLTYAFAELAYNVRRHSGVDNVTIKTQDFGYRLDFAILDRGKGCRLTDKQAAFLPFWQSSTDNPGIGLGLYLTKQFIEGSGGKIAFGSVPNRGTLVKITLETVP
ncbi:MAG: HAMP domain-containing sensor histidine kinase [Chloroflexota bacterium]|nr:HAMP domain-containing sensor histidine kinase [Chloroflexota bacterium]